MNVIEIRGVTKKYSQFALDQVSFGIKQGFITGLIGPNGAGKSTLIKLLMGMAVPEQGEISIFGKPMPQQEGQIKEQIGFVSDESHFYEHLTIAAMKNVIAPFYKQWNEALFKNYLDRFELSQKTKIKNLSKGMKMKFSLACALSHQADLLIMDEPTAGLDPVFRRELLDILGELMLDEKKTILFSTHITTDLDRIADFITFVNRGKLVFSDSKEQILDRYVLVKGDTALLDRDLRNAFIGIRETSIGFEGLSANRSEAERLFGSYAKMVSPTLEDIMYFTAKGGRTHA
ncbi:ABC transporter ATP-binding protein [Paenibacillus eucommiae]|uniref:ABC-2 type transport system ATP-binding protein n=1 Tax=Paenibacillus eucommiae TaxID=1355755 RepID=A0ABS4IU50_9BACL|nr:ABC transporter ATP-binding protein [Paenibacillus eucommiae]MBP1991104.1 ABC-2 type transport system ATP-binding protein [Paenibacillus eucommiae]